jgi:hypothetical protein
MMVCSSLLTAIVIPLSVTIIDKHAFASCSLLKTIVIPPSITSIGDLAFYDYSSLTTIVIPSSVTSTGDLAFEGCSSLAPFVYNGEGVISRYAPRVMIDATVTTTATHAFYN